MGNNTSQQIYENYNVNDITQINKYELFELSKNFTWNELKKSYKKKALLVHPDKGGDKFLFDYLTKSFEELAIEFKNRENNKNHLELKKQSKEHFNKINKMTNTNIKHPSEIFNNNEPFDIKFNKFFEEYKYHDEEKEFGYGDNMVSSSTNRDDIDIKNIFNKNNVDNTTFNNTFNNKIHSNKNNNKVIKYKEPEPLHLVNSDFTQIGAERPQDYSSSLSLSKKLNYTDYMKAYSNDIIINPNDGKTKTFKSIDEYEMYRDSKTNKELSKKHLNYLEKEKEKTENKEYERLERIKKQNIEIKKSYDLASRFMIN